MSQQIPSADRISNKYPPLDPTDKTELNADNVMLILDKMHNGDYKGFKLPSWTTATRPSPPEIGMIGINTDLGQREWFDGDEWRSD